MEPRRTERLSPRTLQDENDRLDELNRLRQLDEASNLRFDHYTSLIADIFGFPVVLVSFVDQDKEWFKSSYGLHAVEVKRDISFCAHAISYREMMIVPDATRDPRFADNPLVTGPPHIRFYAGAVVRSPRGQPLGTLCLVDYRTRAFDEDDQQRLRKFADLLESEINSNYEVEGLRNAIEYSAYFDPLTWLPNRRSLVERLDRMLERARNQAHQVPVLLFSVCSLRLINQGFGTRTGDRLLHQVGDRLIACCPPDGIVCHLQADEFVVTFPANQDRLDTFLGAAHSLLRRPFALDEGELHLDIHVSGSLFPDHGSSAAELLERASVALHYPSSEQRRGVAVFNEQEALSRTERLTVESLLRRAVEEQHFHLVFQPIVSLRSRATAYVEALLRWDVPILQDMGTCKLIRICEESDLISLVGRGVQEQACAQFKAWQEQGVEIPLALNVSPLELERPDFASRFLRDLEQASIPASMFSIELTEYSAASENPTILDNIRTLGLASVRVNVDDFGTGYSALGYLSRIPVSGLKVDRSFISELPANNRQATLTLTILNMADALDLSTVAEGVETREQLEFLLETNCRYAQGYFLSNPVEASMVPRLWGHPLV